jgi:hypothetical protein
MLNFCAQVSVNVHATHADFGDLSVHQAGRVLIPDVNAANY